MFNNWHFFNIIKVMLNRKVLIIGHVSDSKSNGQIAKTKDTISFLKNNGIEVDVYNYAEKSFISILFGLPSKIRKYEKIVIMPGGKRPLFFLVRILSHFKNKKIFYMTIGGWILDLLNDEKNKKYFEEMRSYSGIYVQNKKTLEAFKNDGFSNVCWVSNFSYKKRLSEKDFSNSINNFENNEKFNFVFFARVCKEKGVFMACEAVKDLKEKNPELYISFDIYGEIQNEETKNRLDTYLEKGFINYKGVLSSEDALGALSSYYCMLFPTYYKGEGTPHSIIESFMAGLPVIASDWKYNSEIVENGKTGYIFGTSQKSLNEVVQKIVKEKETIKNMRFNCFKKSDEYNIDSLLKPFLEKIKE